MAERGATPVLGSRSRTALRLLGAFSSPLLPDDYLELFNPLWSTRELRGRVVRVDGEAGGAVTLAIKPGWEWPGHLAGQYMRVGVVVDGRHHWRAYSLTSEPGRRDGLITITPKLVEGGVVSTHLCTRVRPGAVLRLGGVEGTFVLPDPAPRKLLFITAGSGVTPVYAMLAALARRGELAGGASGVDVVHVHSARSAGEMTFGAQLRALAASSPGYELRERHTASDGRLRAGALGELCPDWAGREAYACGPAGLLAQLAEHYRASGNAARLHVEHFTAEGVLGEGAQGRGGTITFTRSEARAVSDGSEPILLAGESEGLELPHGCRMGICHSCCGRLRAGRVRDLRTGQVLGTRGELVRTCVNAPEGDVEIEL
jgi:ferredoxin-NADP reductase